MIQPHVYDKAKYHHESIQRYNLPEEHAATNGSGRKRVGGGRSDEGARRDEFSSLSVDPSQLRTWFRVTKNGVALRGLLVFVPRGGKLWQLTLTEPSTADDASLYRIAQTCTVD